MSRTLFWYIFKDLLKIFMMASGALGGIMSFGGLLRPLTQQGLDASQVSKMLAYFTFPMMAYSLPVAALFAATVVYGRLSADNEITACRAGGISHLGIAMPAFVMGMLVAVVSLLMLCFVVPIYTLKVEKVIYSNLAKLIANRIERSHEIRLGQVNVYAQTAYLPPRPEPLSPAIARAVEMVEDDPQNRRREAGELLLAAGERHKEDLLAPIAAQAGAIGRELASDARISPPLVLSQLRAAQESAEKEERRQVVVLEGVSIVTYEMADKADRSRGDDLLRRRPRDFLTASSATISIGESERNDDQVELYVALEGGTKFPRQFKGGMQAGIGATQFGPIEISSPIKEDTKFMDAMRLKHLYDNPEESRRIKGTLSGLIRHDQAVAYLREAAAQLNGPGRTCRFEDKEGNRIVLTRNASAPAAGVGGNDGEELLLAGPPAATTNPAIPPAVAFSRTGERTLSQLANELRVRIRPDTDKGEGLVTVELMGRRPAGGGRAVSSNFSDTISVKLPEHVARLKDRRLAEYLDPNTKLLTRPARSKLSRDTVVLNNNILSESHGRASFALSCFILVLVGCALGMMFRSGNFLTAFAVSFIPALLCITLIVSGQQTCKAVPWALDQAGNPLKIGLALIWSGNAVNLVLATGLLWRLQRQ